MPDSRFPSGVMANFNSANWKSPWVGSLVAVSLGGHETAAAADHPARAVVLPRGHHVRFVADQVVALAVEPLGRVVAGKCSSLAGMTCSPGSASSKGMVSGSSLASGIWTGCPQFGHFAVRPAKASLGVELLAATRTSKADHDWTPKAGMQ